VEAQGWTIIPTYVGQQAPCSDDHLANPIDPAQAGAEGTAAADDAIAQARRLGLEPGSPIYNDMESYTGDAACHQAVVKFLAAWTQELHAQGYLSGVYGSLASLVKDEVSNYGEPGTPDDLWFANWDDQSQELTNAAIPPGDWANHHRIHQYHADG